MNYKNRGRIKSNMSLRFSLSLVLLALTASCRGVKTESPPSNILVFEGTIEKLAPDQGTLSGRVAVYRLAKYSVERICDGKYDKKEIVVDHLVFNGKEFESAKVGDLVCVRAQISDKVLVRYDEDGIRSPSDVVKTFYVAVDGPRRMSQGSKCCVAEP